jgi:adenosine kinase
MELDPVGQGEREQMKIVLTGSIAFDYLMTFPGRFRDHILLEKLERLSLSFLVDSMVRQRGGIAANIAYTLALLGEKPMLLAAAGMDFDEYGKFLESLGVDTSAVRVYDDRFTASFFVTTDETNAQIASFYGGAMDKSAELKVEGLSPSPDMVVVSANVPAAMAGYIGECTRLNIPFAYDPSQQTVRLDAAPLREGILHCHSLFVNDYEFDLIREKTGMDVPDILANSQFIAITRGADGADIHTKDGLIQVPAAEPEKTVDPTGVGDAFRAGFFKGYMNQLSLLRCGQMGSISAAYCLESQGPQGHSFDLPGFAARFRTVFDDDGELDRLL